MYIERIKEPRDLKALNVEELVAVADEIRHGVMNRVSRHGGHVGPNLGAVEATVAMHYVFDAPKDKLVFDVSHQSYPHKMLTGRAKGFTDEASFDSISGYSSPSESPLFDEFEIGHTSTSISLATGLQKARDLRGTDENIVAFIGDGSLSGGEAFEGLDTAAELGTGIVIVVNDNEMSIAENHGGLYGNLRLLRQTGGKAELNYFRALGFDYVYVERGNDVKALVEAFSKVRGTTRPTVVHIHTEKGHGFAPATERKEEWHYQMPFDPTTGEPLRHGGGEYMPYLLGDWLRSELKRDPKMVCLAAGVPMAVGFTKEKRKEAGRQFIDVGIAEEQAVAMSSALAKGGMRPVFSTYATFIQRTYDQIAQDLCVNGNAAVINVIGSSVFGMNDFTHICFFDIPMLSHIPNLTYLAPTTYEELIAMERWAIRQTDSPVAIRVPECGVEHSSEAYPDDYASPRYHVAKRGSRVAVIGVGDFFGRARRVTELLGKEGIEATLINPRFLSATDAALLDELKADHTVVATIEDGSIDGGFGERIARHYGDSSVRALCFGVRKALYDRYDVDKLLEDNHLTEPQIVEDILAALGRQY